MIICKEESGDTGEREVQGQHNEPGHTANRELNSTLSQAAGKMFRNIDVHGEANPVAAPQMSTMVQKTTPVTNKQAVSSRE